MNSNISITNVNSTSFYQKVIQSILESDNYTVFHNWLLSLLDNKSKGDAQEIFCKIYFLSHRTHYQIKFYYSHLSDKIPENLGVNTKDLGTDAIILHNDNKVSLVQVKFRSNLNSTLKRSYISNMSLESMDLVKKDKLRFLYLFSNTYTQTKNISGTESKYIRYVLNDTLMECNWDLVRNLAKIMIENSNEVSHTTKVDPPTLSKWQKNALDFVFKTGIDFNRRQIIAACGSGKTIFSYHVYC